MSSTSSVAPRELGIPVRAVFHCILHPGAGPGGAPSLLVSMGQHAGGFLVLDVNIRRRTCTQYECRYPNAFEASASFRSRTTGVLYCGSCYTGWLHRYVPGSNAVDDLGPVDEKLANFPCRIDEAPDGSLYVGAYPGCCLSRYEPSTGRWTRFGRMDETDMYFYPLCGVDGTVAGLVKMCRVHVVALDPRTGEHRAVGPVVETQAQSGKTVDLFKGVDGLLYVRSADGSFRIDGLEARPVSSLPDALPAPALPDGATVTFADAESFQCRRIRITSPQGKKRSMSLDWQGAGTNIFLLHDGPDGRVYGSSILPEHMFSCRPDGSDMINHGQCSVAGGEAYSMGNLDGRLYIASYPAARVSIYDPAEPYRFGTKRTSNPRDIGRLDDVACRPRTMVTGPAGKVWIGSIPDYGMWGGTLAWYDPKTRKHRSHRHLMQDCSVISLAWLPERRRLLAGTSVEGGTGTLPRAQSAGFVFWDPFRDEADGVETFGIDDLHSILDIHPAGPRCVYASVVRGKPETPVAELPAELVLLDLDEGRVRDRSPFAGDYGWPLEMAMRLGPDGAVYGATFLQFFRIIPDSAQREVLWRAPAGNDPEYITVAGPIVGRTFYFASRHRLRAIEI